jgi:hypothetical protein
MKKRNRNLVLISVLLVIPFQSNAGRNKPFDIRAGVGFNRNTLNIQSDRDFNLSNSANYNINPFISADYYFTENLGAGLGVEYNRFRFMNTLSNFKHSYTGTDNWESDPVARNYEFFIESNDTDIDEATVMHYLDIPVAAVYRHALSAKTILTARAGLKIGIPLKGSYQLENSNLKTYLYFEEWDLKLSNIPAHGLYDSRTNWHPDGKTTLSLATSVFAEFGIGYQLLPSINSHISAYYSYGLNDIISESQNSLIYWRNTYNSMLTLTEKVSLHQLGLRISFSYSKTKKSAVRGHNLPIM